MMDKESIELAKLIFQVFQFLLTGGIGIYVYTSNKNKATNDRIDVLQENIDAKVDGHSERIAKLEAHAENSPSHDDLAGIHDKINTACSQISSLSGEFKGVHTLLNTIHRYLLGKE